MHAVRRFGRSAAADSIRHDEVILGGVQRLAGTKELAADRRRKKIFTGGSGAVKQQDNVGDFALSVFMGRANRGVMQLQFRKRLSTLELEVLDDEVSFLLVGIARRIGLRKERGGDREQGYTDHETTLQVVFHRIPGSSEIFGFKTHYFPRSLTTPTSP